MDYSNNDLLLKLESVGFCEICAWRYIDSCGKNGIIDKIKRKIDNDGNPKKIGKCNPCIICVGLLQESVIETFIGAIERKLAEANFDCPTYMLALILPTSLILREHSANLYLKDLYPERYESTDTDGSRIPYCSLKDACRSIISSRLIDTVSKRLDSKSDLIITMHLSYNNDLQDCRSLAPLMKKNTRRSASVSSKEIGDILDSLSNKSALSVYFSCPPTEPLYSIELTSVNIQRNSVFCAGRYNKYSRNLPQTPWILDGERKIENSVQELIVLKLESAFKSEGSRFSSSGREDVDVRTLGLGRPFVVEFINPRISRVSSHDLRNIESEINNEGFELIFVRDLQMVSRGELSNLKDGEEKKTKDYTALCVIDGHVSLEFLEKCCNRQSEITIQQKTPIRVLHRRNVAVRPKIIHSMKIESIDMPSSEGKTFFKLHVKTQAGTYIKEFVHGDFGRTVPNVSDMLGGVAVDVVALDVTNVELDWPTPVVY